MTAELIARLESADGPSGSLLLEAAKAVWVWGYVPTGVNPDVWVKRWNRFHRMLDAEAWTSAAEMLVPEGCLSMVRTVWADAHAPTERPVGYASVDRYFKDDAGLFWKENFLALGETPALALAAAALKARGV